MYHIGGTPSCVLLQAPRAGLQAQARVQVFKVELGEVLSRGQHLCRTTHGGAVLLASQALHAFCCNTLGAQCVIAFF